MRTNWAAAAVGLALSVVAGATPTQLPDPPPRTLEERDGLRMDQSINQGDWGSQVGPWRDLRPWRQRQWEHLFPPPVPERPQGGIV